MDFMYICREFKKRGIKVVGMIAEMDNTDGTDFSFTGGFVPEAEAMVSTGNKEELVTLPPVEKVIGGDKVRGQDTWAGQQLSVPIKYLLCANAQMGAWNIAAKAY
jgi:glycine reductase